MLLRPSSTALFVLVTALGCGDTDDVLFGALDSGDHPLGSLQARLQLGGEGVQPFVADEALAMLSPGEQGDELVVHATDRAARRTLALVITLSQADVPGTIDLADHVVVYTELDAAGHTQLVLDDVPTGSVDLLGTLVPGGEVTGAFQFALPESDSAGTPFVGVFEGAFTAPILPDRRISPLP